MTTSVLGAGGATGRLPLEQLLDRGLLDLPLVREYSEAAAAAAFAARALDPEWSPLVF